MVAASLWSDTAATRISTRILERAVAIMGQ
jgi:hypothetical protein